MIQRFKNNYLKGFIKLNFGLIFFIISYSLHKNSLAKTNSFNDTNPIIHLDKNNSLLNLKKYFISSIKWERYNKPPYFNQIDIKWNKYYKEKENEKDILPPLEKQIKKGKNNKKFKLNSLNRSLIFDDKIIGPDISWLVPPGLKWTKNFKVDFSTRGHNRRINNDPFFGWNGGDAVGQIYLQPIHWYKYSLGINFGVRSIYSGSRKGGSSDIGEGLSMGFRIDKALSNDSGIAFGAEQLLHFDGLTDTGRDIYITATKSWWHKKIEGKFPLKIATFGFGTGKLSEGNIKGLCSDLFGGSGTEVAHQRSLCWSPIFSITRVHNPKFSTFFEYNSKWFLLGNSIIPNQNIPLRGTFAIQLSDHIDNYKLNNFNELKWVFRLSYGF